MIRHIARALQSALIIATLSTSMVALPVHADSRLNALSQRVLLAQAAGMSRQQAAAVARSTHGGKVLSVSEQSRGGQIVYRVKLLQDSGRVKIVYINGPSRRSKE